MYFKISHKIQKVPTTKYNIITLYARFKKVAPLSKIFQLID